MASPITKRFCLNYGRIDIALINYLAARVFERAHAEYSHFVPWCCVMTLVRFTMAGDLCAPGPLFGAFGAEVGWVL